MKIMLVPQSGALGIGGIARLLAVAEAAQLKGHRVAVLAPPRYPLMRQYMQDAIYFRCPKPKMVHVGTGEAQTFAESLRIRGMLEPDYLVAAIESELSAVRHFRPDVIVTENQITIPLTARIADIPYAATIATINLKDEEDRKNTLLTHALTSAARRFKVDWYDRLEDAMHREALYNFAPTIVELEPKLISAPNVSFVGPVLFGPIELAPAPSIASDDRVKVLVYLSKGSVTWLNFRRRLTTAFPSANFQIIAVVRTESSRIRQELTGAGLIVSEMPGITKCLQPSDLLVTRGGQNTLMAAALAECPVVGLPGASAEPLFNLVGMQACGLPCEIVTQVSDSNLRQAYGRLKHADSSRASRLAELLRAKGGAQSMVRQLEQALA